MAAEEINNRSDAPQVEPPAPTPELRTLRSEELFAGERMIMIEHAGAQYRLMITRNDRLILQK
jgi:hemin uptake protein HemP